MINQITSICIGVTQYRGAMTWPTSNPISREIDDFWKESQSLTQQWWVEADRDTKMLMGQQNYGNNSFGFNNMRNNEQLQFNKLLRLHNMIGGYQRDNRLATIVQPGDNDPDSGETADQRSVLINWSMHQDNTYDRISDCFDGAVTTGLNLMNIWMDFRQDPENGEIKTERLPYNSFIMDNYWTKSDLSDCDRVLTRRYLGRRQLLSLYPKAKKDLPLYGKGYAAKDGKFQYLAQNWSQGQQEMYAYDEYWTQDYKSVRKILDTRTGEVVDWDGTYEQFQMFRKYNSNVELITAKVPTVKLHVLINNNVIYEEKSPYGLDRLPFVPFLCYHYPEAQNYAFRYQGIIRACRDSQIELNRRRNRMLDILDAQVQSGLMVKEDALVNPEDAFFQGPGKILFFKNSSNLASDVAPIPSPPVAQGWMELIQSIESEIMDIVGPEELFAQNLGNKDMSGVLLKLKMGAGLTGLRNIFDRLNLSQKYIGEIFDQLIVNNFSPGKIARILGKPPTEFFFDNSFTKYSCNVEEAELTASQRQLQFMQAMNFKQMGMNVPTKYLIEKSTLSGKKELIESMMQEEQQAAQMQQQQAQAQLQQQQMLAHSLGAKAEADLAAAEERKTRAVADIGLAKERASQAEHDRAKTALDNAKALQELDAIPENRLMGLMDFILNMQERQQALSGGEEEDSELVAQRVGSNSNNNEAMGG